MSDFDELLRPLLETDRLGDPTPGEELEGRVRRWHRIRQLAVVAGAAVVVGVFAVALGSLRGGDSPEQVELVGLPPEPESGVFSTQSDEVLVFSDGAGGIVVVDLDNEVAVRRRIEGDRPGDHPHRLHRVDNSLIVGWGEIIAVDIGTAQSQVIDEATIFVPATELDRVWTLDWPGGRIGAGEPTRFRQVNPDGNVLFETEQAGLGFSERAIPGGLVFETDHGLDLWDAAAGEIVGTIGDGRAWPRAVHDNQLAYSDNDGNLYLADVATQASEPIAVPAGWGPTQGAVVFSPDGSTLAGLATQGLLLVDTAAGEVTTVPVDATTPLGSAAWSPDGQYFYLSAGSWQESEHTLARLDIATETFESVTLPFGGAMANPVVLTRAEATAFLDVEMVDPADCPPPGTQGAYNGTACAFSFGPDPTSTVQGTTEATVIAVNGSGVPGTASTVACALSSTYGEVEAKNAQRQEDQSHVENAPGHETAAAGIAELLGIPVADGDHLGDHSADIVVVVGSDIQEHIALLPPERLAACAGAPVTTISPPAEPAEAGQLVTIVLPHEQPLDGDNVGLWIWMDDGDPPGWEVLYHQVSLVETRQIAAPAGGLLRSELVLRMSSDAAEFITSAPDNYWLAASASPPGEPEVCPTDRIDPCPGEPSFEPPG